MTYSDFIILALTPFIIIGGFTVGWYIGAFFDWLFERRKKL